jgi:hypothetical protein
MPSLFEFIRVNEGVNFMELLKGGARYKSFGTSALNTTTPYKAFLEEG